MWLRTGAQAPSFRPDLCTTKLLTQPHTVLNSVIQNNPAKPPVSSTLAWKIPWTEEPGRLQSMESLRVGHDWETSLSRFTFMHWRRKWQPTPVFLPGESQGRWSLMGCHLWGRTESDTTEATQQQQQQQQAELTNHWPIQSCRYENKILSGTYKWP